MNAASPPGGSGRTAPNDLSATATVSRVGLDAVVHARGERDLSTCVPLAAALAQAHQDTDRDVLLDVQAVTFADASTLAVIVHADNQLRHDDQHVVVMNASPWVDRLFRMASLDHLLENRT